MNYVEKHLIPGETLQYQTKLHWHVMLWHVAFGVIIVLAGMAILAGSWDSKAGKTASPGVRIWFALVFFGVAGGLIAFGVLKRKATEIAVTNKRVIVKMGIATRRTIEVLLPRIESISVEEPAIGRLLGYGTVTIRGTGGTPEVFENISHPLEFRQQVQRQIEGNPGVA